MKELLACIKTVLATKDFGTHLNHYLFEPGLLMSSDGRMVAGVPTTLDVHCLVPGPELEAVVGRFPDIISVSHIAPKMTISGGLLRGTIDTLSPDQVQFYRPDGKWLAPPPNLVEALRMARPFIAENAVQIWALCASLHGGAVTATNNMSIVRVDCPGLEPEQEILIPAYAIDFVLKHAEPLVGVIWTSQYAAFLWESGLWFRTHVGNGSFPAQIAKILSQPERATTPIDKAWLAEYKAVADLSEGLVTIGFDQIVGGKGKAEVRAAITTAVDTPVLFNPKFLTPVLVAADFWAPQVYPAPVPFRGKGFSGVVIGRKA